MDSLPWMVLPKAMEEGMQFYDSIVQLKKACGSVFPKKALMGQRLRDRDPW